MVSKAEESELTKAINSLNKTLKEFQTSKQSSEIPSDVEERLVKLEVLNERFLLTSHS